MGSYLVLKPLCDDVRLAPSAQNIGALRTALESIQPQMLQLMQDFVLLPLLNQVDADAQHCRAELKAHLLDTITALLQRTQLRQLMPFKVLTVIVLKQIFDPARMSLLAGLSDELKLSALQCIRQAFVALTFEVRTEFYAATASGAQLGQVVYVTLQLVEHDRYRRIRLTALGALLAVFNVYDGADLGDAELRQHVADRVFTMLPKVAKVLLQVIDGDVKEPLEMKVRAIDALGKYLCVVFEDYGRMGCSMVDAPGAAEFRELFAPRNVPESNAGTGDVLDISRSLNKPLGDGEPSGRSVAWLEAAIQRLQPIFVRLLRHTGSEVPEIRQQLAEFAANLFRCTPPNIQQHLEPILQILIVLGRDDVNTIADGCQQVLRTLQTGAGATAFLDQLDALFHKLLITCPRVMATGEETERFALLRLFAGVASAARLRLVLGTGDAMERFCTLLLFMLTLQDGDGVAALRESGTQLRLEFDGGADAAGAAVLADANPWRKYEHLSARVGVAAEELCRIVGRSAAGEAVFEQMMARMRDRTAGSNEALLALQLMLVGDGWAEVERCKRLLTELMTGTEHWELDVRPVGGGGEGPRGDYDELASNWHEDRTPGLYVSAISVRYTDMMYRADDADGDNSALSRRLTLAEASVNVQHICLTLETIGRLAQTLQHLYQPFLLRSLYRILVKTGSANDRIREAGHFALAGIAKAFGHGCIAALVEHNFDYVCHSVRMALRRTAECADALAMLAVLLRFAPLETVPQWQTVVSTVLEASGRRENGELVLEFLLLFRRLLEHLERQETVKEGGLEGSDGNKWPDERAIREQWLEILTGVDPSVEDDCDDDGGGEEERIDTGADEGDDDTSTKPEPTSTVQITNDIMQRCIHYLPHKTRIAQCQALDTLLCGFRVLRLAGADSTMVLSLAHAVWRPFVERVRGRDAVVLRRCFALMLEMGAVAQDFMCKRTVSDIFPLVLEFLKQAAVESRERVKDASFENSQTHRLAVELLDQLPALIRHLDIAEPDLDALLNAALPLLHTGHHRDPLQRSARHFFQSVSAFDAAAVYAKLAQLLRTGGPNVQRIFGDTAELCGLANTLPT